MNINDLFQAAETAEDVSYGDLLGPNELAEGAEVLCEIVYSKAGTTKKGAPSWTNKLKVLEGEYEGGEFFDSIYLSANATDGGRSYNKRQFAKIGATGLGAQFFSSNPSAEAIATAMSGGKGNPGKKVLVKVSWQKPDGFDSIQDALDAGERVFGQHTWSPADSAPSGGPAGYGTPPGY